MKTFFVIIGHYLPVFSIRVEVRMSFRKKMQMDGMSEFESNSEEVVNSEVALKNNLLMCFPKL